MKLEKKTKIAILTFVALGVTGIAVIKVKQYIDKKRANKNKANKNKTMKVIFELPKDLK